MFKKNCLPIQYDKIHGVERICFLEVGIPTHPFAYKDSILWYWCHLVCFPLVKINFHFPKRIPSLPCHGIKSKSQAWYLLRFKYYTKHNIQGNHFIWKNHTHRYGGEYLIKKA